MDSRPRLLVKREQGLSKEDFSMPWQVNLDGEYEDTDGFSSYTQPTKDLDRLTRVELQQECWNKFNANPQINTSIRGLMGRLTGWMFEVTSEIEEIQDAIEQIWEDPRNKLYSNMPKFVGRSKIEGELFLCLTCHEDGFVEVDFLDPKTIDSGGDNDTGIIFHPTKRTFPLFYNVLLDHDRYQIPSINIARYPELVNLARKHKDWDTEAQSACKSNKPIFEKFKGYNRFVVAWDMSLLTQRNTSHLRTTIEWINHYENLKKYEIDHKKSAGSYLWTVSFLSYNDFRVWTSLTDEEKRKTGLLAKKTPGGTLFVPPGMTLEVKNPTLPSIKEQDTDILEMVASGLNEPSDVMTGSSKGTFASVKASRGPMSDRVADEMAEFERFLRYDFWGSIFFLKVSMGFLPPTFPVKEVVGFKEPIKKKKPEEPKPAPVAKKDEKDAKKFADDSEPDPKKEDPKKPMPEPEEEPEEEDRNIYKVKQKKPEQLVDISFPVSETIDLETRTKALLGVKHGPMSENLGIPYSDIARRIGFGGSYGRLRKRQATEKHKYPELVYATEGVDQESKQEDQEGERNIDEQAAGDKNGNKTNEGKGKDAGKAGSKGQTKAVPAKGTPKKG